MSKLPIRVGVVGVGYIGSLHAQSYAKLPGVKLAAVCDANPERAAEVAARLGCEAVGRAEDLIGRVEAASVCVPTSLHHRVGQALLEAGVHVLIEKPIATSLSEADALVKLAKLHKLVLQVGHVERFNAAIHAAKKHLTHPRFIEAHRLSPYPHRSIDVSVVLDVMIHDLDLILHLVGEAPRRVEAVGIPVISRSEDIANARLVFPNGCVANVTASRVSDETLRRFRVFQEDCYLSIDSKAQGVEFARKDRTGIHREALPVTPRPPLEEELAAFAASVGSRSHPTVSGEEARDALGLALHIERLMRRAVKKPTKRA